MSLPANGLQFLPATDATTIQSISALAGPIWREAFTPIIGPEQVEFMLVDWQSPQAIAKQISEGARYYLARQNQTDVGYCAWIPEPDQKAKLSKFYIASAYHGSGYAQTMMQFLEQQARQHGCHTLWLQVNRNNHRAIRFYQKSGFRVVRDLYQQVGPGFFIDDHIMEKSFPETGVA